MYEIKIDHLTRVEGHGNLTINLKEKKVEDVQFNIVEGPRLFEAIMRGRPYWEMPEFGARICGICEVSHAITAAKAVEDAFGFMENEEMMKLRDLAIFAQVIQSHVLHDYFLSLPDHLGAESVMGLASKYPEEVNRAVRLNKLANDVKKILGGRDVHPINFKVGGFYMPPSKEDIEKIEEKMKQIREDAIKMVELFASLQYPEFKRKTQFLALYSKGEYALTRGILKTLDGVAFKQEEYQRFIMEKVFSHSTAKHSFIDGKSIMVGALSRLNINRRFLSDGAKDMLGDYDIKLPSHNSFLINVAQAIETLHCAESAIDLTSELKDKNLSRAKLEPKVKEGEGIAFTEAPRGSLLHHYKIDEDGKVTYANVITPTVINARNVEEDIKEFVPTVIDEGGKNISIECEKLIRAYDPCISCSTHFLDTKFRR